MTTIRSTGRRARRALLVLVVGAGAGACSSAPGSASFRGSTPAGTPLVEFVTAGAVAANGVIPAGTAAGTCGSPKYGWVSELTHVPISQARVTRHWAAFIPTRNGLAAKQMEASGSITGISYGGPDVPFDHPFGGDMSFNEKMAAPYSKLDQNLGTSGGNGPVSIHDELMTGLLPHPVGTVDVSPGLSWRVFAANTARDVTAGFFPQRGDQVAVMGSWVVDCGHTDFHSELHSVTFMAYAHRLGLVTVAHAFYNPFEVAQVFNPDPSLTGRVTEPGLLAARATQPFTKYLVTEILRLAGGKDRQPTVPVMLEPNTQSPTPWTVCAPAGTSGSRLEVSYAFAVRSGVSVHVTTDKSKGCTAVTTQLTSSYLPADAPGQQLCPTDWAWLSSVAFNEAGTFGGTGNVPHDIPQVVLNEVRTIAPSLVPALRVPLNRPLLSVCFPSMTVSDLSSPTAGVQSVTTADQILPLAGWIEVGWTR